jgi:hypothetical protein
MVDVSAPHGDRSIFHACTHTKVSAASFHDGTSVIYPPFPCYDYGYYQFVDSWTEGLDEVLWVTPEDLSFASALDSAVASASWLDETVALARSVKGLVNSKTLLGATIKEIPETVRMVLNPFGLLKGGWRHIAERHTAKQLMAKSANLWLEYQYGWKATYIDFRNFSKSVDKYLSSRQRYQDRALERYSERAIRILDPPPPTVDDATWDSFRVQFDHGTTYGDMAPKIRVVFAPGQLKTAVSLECTDKLSQHVTRFDKALSALGLDKGNVVETLWEVIPYSFVVDWFVNTKGIVDTFRQAEALETFSQAGASRLGYSAKAEFPFKAQRYTGQGSNYYPSLWYPYPDRIGGNHSSDSWLGSVSSYQRSVGPPPYSMSLFTTNGLSVTQGISGASLIFQRLLGRR